MKLLSPPRSNEYVELAVAGFPGEMTGHRFGLVWISTYHWLKVLKYMLRRGLGCCSTLRHAHYGTAWEENSHLFLFLLLYNRLRKTGLPAAGIFLDLSFSEKI